MPGQTLMPAAPTGTASINVRLSKEAREENLSKEGMIEDCRVLAERMGLTVVNVHIDDGISGSVRNRPGFVAWLNDAREGRVDHLIAWHVDRMTREGVNAAALILDTVEGKDPETGRVIRPPVRLLDTKGLDSAGDETSFRFRFLIAAEVARAERERMRDRSRTARRRAVAERRWPGGPAPFGFRMVPNPDGPGKVLEQVPSEAAFVREAAERLLAGASFYSVVRFANGPDGHPPRRAKHWWAGTLRQTLTGFPVAGRVVRFVNGKAEPVLDSAGMPVTIPAILTADESAAVRRLLLRTPTRKGGRAPARLLSGLLLCASCSRPLRVTRRGPGEAIYRCQTGAETGTCPRQVSISADVVEAHVSDLFLSTWGNSPAYTWRAHVAGEAAIADAEEEIAAALAALNEDPTPDNLTRLQQAKAAREEALAAPQETTARVVPTGRTVRGTWDVYEAQNQAHAVDPEQPSGIPDQRALLAANYAAILVRPTRRGNRLDPSRLVVMSQPPFPIEAGDPVTLTPGRMAA
jgi:site-specific DNA recombinase